MTGIKNILKGDFVKSVAVLMTGTVLAQVISYALWPIIADYYNQSQMADFNLYMRVISFIGALATARFEMSLPLPKSDSHSFLLFRLSLKIAMITLLISGIAGLVYFWVVSGTFNYFLFGLLSLLSAFFVVFINLGTNWSIRKGQFSRISYSRITNSVVSNSLRLGFGLLHWGSFGIIFASLLGYFTSSLGFVKDFLSNNILYKHLKSKRKTFALATEYREFPLVSLPHVLIDLGRDLLVAFMIIYFFGKDVFGSYGFSLMMLSVPIAIIGQAISQVFFKQCSEIVNRGEAVEPLLIQTMKTLIALSIVPFAILFFWGEPIFTFVFDAEWTLAGRLSEIMAVYMFFNFVISPISNLPIILNRQRAYLILGIVNTSIQLFFLGLLPFWVDRSLENFESILWGMSIAQSVLLIYTSFLFIKFARNGRKMV